MSKELQEQIKARADKTYPMPDANTYYSKVEGLNPDSDEFGELANDLMEKQMKASGDHKAYTAGAESMLPVMEDVALAFLIWYNETDLVPPPEMDTDGKLYQHFITNIYKP